MRIHLGGVCGLSALTALQISEFPQSHRRSSRLMSPAFSSLCPRCIILRRFSCRSTSLLLLIDVPGRSMWQLTIPVSFGCHQTVWSCYGCAMSFKFRRLNFHFIDQLLSGRDHRINTHWFISHTYLRPASDSRYLSASWCIIHRFILYLYYSPGCLHYAAASET